MQGEAQRWPTTILSPSGDGAGSAGKPLLGGSGVGFEARRNLHRDQKVASEKIVKQMSERWGATQLGGRNHAICLAPFPTGGGNILQPFAQICGGHRIRIDSNVLREEPRKSFEKPPFEIAINVFEGSNH